MSKETFLFQPNSANPQWWPTYIVFNTVLAVDQGSSKTATEAEFREPFPYPSWEREPHISPFHSIAERDTKGCNKDQRG